MSMRTARDSASRTTMADVTSRLLAGQVTGTPGNPVPLPSEGLASCPLPTA